MRGLCDTNLKRTLVNFGNVHIKLILTIAKQRLLDFESVFIAIRTKVYGPSTTASKKITRQKLLSKPRRVANFYTITRSMKLH